MKINRIKIPIAFLLLTTMAACSDYLDVEEEGTFEDTLLFETYDGYVEAMAGVYISMLDASLYRENLSYGFMDNLAQLYEPNATLLNSDFESVIKYNYQDQLLKPRINGIWSSTYRSISYLNNIIKHIDREDVVANPDFNLIKGEAYGLRAFLHFEMVRIFTETITSNPQAMGIPYAEEFSVNAPKRYSLETIYGKILMDLDKAEAALTQDSFTHTTINTTEEREGISNDFELDRDIHFNKYAVWATKARVFLWRGDMEQAAIYAKKVIDSPEVSLFEFTELSNDENYPFGKETIWALYGDNIDKFSSNVETSFLTYRTFLEFVVRKDVADIYETSSANTSGYDRRFSKYFRFDGFIRFIRLMSDINDKVTGIAMIRLPEMYYIAAEAYYDTEPQLAIGYLDKVRTSRGLSPLKEEQANTKTKFMDEIFKEKYKELWGEGQLFLEYKRLNKNIVDGKGNIIQASNDVFVLPWPDKELEFGN